MVLYLLMKQQFSDIHIFYICCQLVNLISLQAITKQMLEKQGNTERYRSFDNLLRVVINTSLSSFCFGYANGYFNSIAFDDIISIYGLEQYPRSTTQGVLTGFINVTGGIGAILSSYLLHHLSRNQCFQYLACGTIVVCILLMIEDINLLFAARLFQGLLIGATSAINPLYIKQFSPIQLSGTLGPINQLLIVIGITYAFTQTYILSLIFPVWFYWRIVFGFPILISCIQLYNLKYRFPYQTPKWLILKNKQKQAKQLLHVIYKDAYVDHVYQQIKQAIKRQQKRQSHGINDDWRESIQMVEYRASNPNITTKHQKQQLRQKLLSRVRSDQENNLTTNTLAIIMSLNLSFHQQMVGMGAIIAYSGEISGQVFPSTEKVFPIFINIMAVVGVFFSLPVLKAWGRKRNLELGGFSIALLLFLLARFFGQMNFNDMSQNSGTSQFFVMIIFITIRGLFSVTLGPIVWLYISQVVQPNMVPIITMFNWLTVFLINLLFPILRQALGGNPSHIFDIFAFYTLGASIINYFFLIQTQNKTQMQIRQEYDQKWEKLRR